MKPRNLSLARPNHRQCILRRSRNLVLTVGCFIVVACAMPSPASTGSNYSNHLLLTLSSPEKESPASAERGKAYFTTCVGCHGVRGQGELGMHAPNLTILGSGYLVRQLRNFRDRVRGGTEDFYGWQMNGRANALPDDLALRDVASYIETLPDFMPSTSIQGNRLKGRSIYVRECAACHGEQAEGISALGAPRLQGQYGWYQIQQLKSFRVGVRGVKEEDARGRQMKPYADALENEAAVLDVVSYITSLDQPERMGEAQRRSLDSTAPHQ